MKRFLPSDLSRLNHQEQVHLAQQLLQYRKHVETIVADAAASLTLMFAINEARKIHRFDPDRTRLRNPYSTSEYTAAQDTLRTCMPMTAQFRSKLFTAWRGRAAYMSDPSNSDRDIIINLVIPESISRARLLRGEHPEEFKTLSKITSRMPKELSSLYNIYKDRFDRRRQARDILDKVSKLVMFQTLHQLEEFEKDVAELSTKHWMTDAGASAVLESLYGPSLAWSMPGDSESPYIEEGQSNADLLVEPSVADMLRRRTGQYIRGVQSDIEAD